MKRKFAALTGAVFMAGAALTASAPSQAVEIEYWQYFFQGRVDAIDALIEQFEAENPDITVVHTHFPYADYRTKVAAAIPAGEGPDVVQLFYGWLNDYIDAQLIQAGLRPALVLPPSIPGFRNAGLGKGCHFSVQGAGLSQQRHGNCRTTALTQAHFKVEQWFGLKQF